MYTAEEVYLLRLLHIDSDINFFQQPTTTFQFQMSHRLLALLVRFVWLTTTATTTTLAAGAA